MDNGGQSVVVMWNMREDDVIKELWKTEFRMVPIYQLRLSL